MADFVAHLGGPLVEGGAVFGGAGGVFAGPFGGGQDHLKLAVQFGAAYGVGGDAGGVVVAQL